MSSEVTATTSAPAAAGGKKDLSTLALIIGTIGLIISLIGLLIGLRNADPRPLIGWLIGLSFWLSISIGMLFLIMLFYLFDSGWSVIIRRQLEHAVSSLKWLALIFLPLLFVCWFYQDDPGILWAWVNTDKILISGETVGSDVLYQAKSGYLNITFFSLRTIVFFLIWIGLAEIFRFSSYAMDRDGDLKHVRRCRVFAAAGIIITSLTVTFASIDWFKSLDYHWFSTMFGVWFFSACIWSSLAATVIICYLLQKHGYLKGILNNAHYYYLGCLMLAFTVFWAYISFSQYFLVYNANIPEETYWYNLREVNADGSKNSWWWISLGLIFFHFFFPFLWLLWYKNKYGARIVFISVWFLIFHLIDLYWNILPGKIALESGYMIRQFTISIWDVSMILGAGGICTWSFARSMKKAQAIPIHDPRILESTNAYE